MDSPLTTAEVSRLRKAINQRERLLSQGLSVATAESNIARALTNLKIYISQSQPQLAAVLRDWETADQAKKAEIIVWLRQNILGELRNEAPTCQHTSALPAQPPIQRSNFVAPPPPPCLPAKAQTPLSETQAAPSPPGQKTSTPTHDPPALNASPRPLPTPSHSHLRHSASLGQAQIRRGPTPLRELHTRAAPNPLTPPPKEYHPVRSASIRQSSGPGTVEHLILDTQGLTMSPSPSEPQLNFSASPVTSAFPRSSSSSTSNETGSSVPQRVSPQISNFATRASTYPQMQPVQSHSPGHGHQTHTVPASAPTSQSQPSLTTQASPQTAATQKKRHSKLFSKLSQGSAHHMGQFLEAMRKYHSQSTQSQPHSPAQPAPGSNAGNSFAQLLIAYQQQQQQQTNQILAALQQQQQQQQQQHQQSTPSSDLAQLLAQSQKQNQDFINMLVQMQANSAPPSFNPSQSADLVSMLAQMQTSDSGLDVSSLISALGSGGGGFDWTSVASTALRVIDPTGLSGMLLQSLASS